MENLLKHGLLYLIIAVVVAIASLIFLVLAFGFIATLLGWSCRIITMSTPAM
jgi:hypothetical protein